jgi:hypothetical protein
VLVEILPRMFGIVFLGKLKLRRGFGCHVGCIG